MSLTIPNKPNYEWYERRKHVKISKSEESKKYLDTAVQQRINDLGSFFPDIPNTEMVLDFTVRTKMWQNVGRTSPITDFGQPVGYVDGGMYNASQSVNDDRPFYARHPKTGVRNLLQQSYTMAENAGGAGITVAPGTHPDPDGNMLMDTLVNSVDGNDRIAKRSPKDRENGVTYTASVIIDSNNSDSGDWELVLGKATEHRVWVEFDPANLPASMSAIKDSSTGTIWAGVSTHHEDLGNGFHRIGVTGTAVNATAVELDIGFWNRDTTTGHDIVVGRLQLEEGTSPSAYQNRENAYDVTEAGVNSITGIYFEEATHLNIDSAIASVFSGTTPHSLFIGSTIEEGGGDYGRLFRVNKSSSPRISYDVFLNKTVNPPTQRIERWDTAGPGVSAPGGEPFGGSTVIQADWDGAYNIITNNSGTQQSADTRQIDYTSPIDVTIGDAEYKGLIVGASIMSRVPTAAEAASIRNFWDRKIK